MAWQVYLHTPPPGAEVGVLQSRWKPRGSCYAYPCGARPCLLQLCCESLGLLPCDSAGPNKALNAYGKACKTCSISNLPSALFVANHTLPLIHWLLQGCWCAKGYRWQRNGDAVPTCTYITPTNWRLWGSVTALGMLALAAGIGGCWYLLRRRLKASSASMLGPPGMAQVASLSWQLCAPLTTISMYSIGSMRSLSARR